MNDFTIKDLESLSGIKAHTIRIWEQRYNFLKPKRTDTNIRCYTNEELKTVLNVALLNKYGFKLCHIDLMKPDEICAKVLSLGGAEAEQERVVNELVRDMVDMETEKFEAALNKYIIDNGIEETMLRIVFRFLEKIGILWQTGHIMPAQEHFVSNIIRQKLIVAIDSAEPSGTINKKILLFLPEKEHHELGLLFLYYLLKVKGAKVTYLGANVPMDDVENVVYITKPDLAFIHLTSSCPNFNFERLLDSIPQRLNRLPVIISGYPTCKCSKQPPPSISFKKTFREVSDFISTI
jgi:MerR family transcriptional regulator, light-induced transcriptional regulator